MEGAPVVEIVQVHSAGIDGTSESCLIRTSPAMPAPVSCKLTTARIIYKDDSPLHSR